MVEITVLKDFIDAKENTKRHTGDKFKAEAARAEEISKKLPGFIEFAENPELETKKPKRTRKKTTKKD